MSRLDAPLEPAANKTMRAHLTALPPAIAEQLAARGLTGTVRVTFEEPASAGVQVVTRSHPLVAVLADSLLEGALDPGSSLLPPLGRAGAWLTTAVKVLTTIVLLRLRHQLTVHARRERLLLAEEAGALAFESGTDRPSRIGEAALALLEQPASGNLAPVARDRLLTQARERIAAALSESIAEFARERAEVLAEDHGRVRAALPGISRVSITPVLPVDVIGMYVLVPGDL
jgi:hypothetical protein